MVDTENHDRVIFTDIEAILKLRHLRLKKPNNFSTSLLPIKELDFAGSPSSDINHLLERWVFKHLNGLQVSSESTGCKQS